MNEGTIRDTSYRRVKWTEYKIRVIDGMLMPYRLSHINIKTMTDEQDIIRYLLAHAVLSTTIEQVLNIWRMGNVK